MPEPPDDAWFDALARFLGPAYLRNAFTYGTEQEVDHLVARLALHEGDRVLDLGCGPGRHALALARRGIEVVGIDHSDEFVALARQAAQHAQLTNARFERADVRALDKRAEFDAVICLCQGGFGLLGGREDVDLLRRFARALKPGGRLALTAFHVAFAVRFLEDTERFDPATGVNHERATLRDQHGHEQAFDLWTTCFTPRELRLMATAAGLTVDHVSGVAPGRYGDNPPTLEDPEILLVASRRIR
ncbi:MAG TPA: class I SAM-dependent methyltransferase [Acidimicrobiia bacterium]|nr:class I SAM-dependent methyltransferase [Acidimicrobiia bacterium]